MPQRGPPKGNNSNESTPKPVPKPNQKRGDNKGNTPKKPEPMDTGSKSDAFNLGKPLEIERPQNGTVWLGPCWSLLGTPFNE